MQYYKSPRAVSVRVARIKAADVNRNTRHSPVDINIAYRNYTTTPITCVLRNGFGFQIPPESRPGQGEFVVSVTYSLWKSVKTDVHHILNEVNDESSHEMKAIAAALQHGSRSYDGQRTVFTVDFAVTGDELRRNGGTLYLRDLDLLVSVLESPHIPTHPYHPRTLTRDLAEEDPGINDTTLFGYHVRIVDNEGAFGDHYINLNGEVFRIPACRDHDRENGVYLVSSHPVSGDHPPPPPRVEHLTFEEATKKLRLYRTYADACVFGDALAERERELKELALVQKREEQELKNHRVKLENERLVKELELESQKAAFDERRRSWEELKSIQEEERRQRQEAHKLRELELAERAARLKAEREELDHLRQLESLRRKDHYEDRSYRRKDFGEFLKYIPVATTAIATLYVAYLKAKGNNK